MKFVMPRNKTFQMITFKSSYNDKLINQTSCKYVRRAIFLILIINIKCQPGC